MKEKQNRILNALNKISDVSNIQTDTNDISDEKVLSIGDFDIDSMHYSFFYSEGHPLIIGELTVAFTYEKVKFTENLHLYQALNNFNKKSIAIKASILQIDKKNKELTVEFSYGFLEDMEFSKEKDLDLQPAVSILAMVPEKLSAELKNKKIVHDYLVGSH
ncbi:hypothetical protein J7U69_22720 [Escherichia coli]|jgi:hypothetical protein|nr:MULTISPECIES: hypothetical protein [Enterobacteriaceae]MBC9653882.1 hypothetical protein [Escherichia coli]MBM2678511.1 hypothetical protein [Klebsiella pneumoniae]MBM6470110.1 hypothetical protein [Klebsiella pneumoniae]MBM7160105.1 hypothetical protein [Klebsiella pneumoniae]MBO9218787.1 hypothetical protein [Escherichia coli]